MKSINTEKTINMKTTNYTRNAFRGLRSLYLLCLLSFIAGISTNTFAQLSGAYSIPGSYSTIAAAVTDLNTVGVSGAVTITVAASYTETAPAGGYLLGSATLN